MRLRNELADQGWEVVPVVSAERLFAILGDLGADMVLLDTDIPDRDATELCGDIRATEAGRFLPIMLISMKDVADDTIAEGLMAGADDFCLPLARPFEFVARVRVQLRQKRVRDRLRRVRHERDHYKRAAKVDALTGLLNRGSFDSILGEAMTEEATFGILFIDVDHFKSINDQYGHDVGDEVLRRVAKRIEQSARGKDRCGRYGGEEFVVLVHGADMKIAAAVAERHRVNIEALAIPALQKGVTASVGYAVFDPAHPDLSREALYKRADSALYRAKRNGRNRVEKAFGPDEVSNVFELPAPLSRAPSAPPKPRVTVPPTEGESPPASQRVPHVRMPAPPADDRSPQDDLFEPDESSSALPSAMPAAPVPSTARVESKPSVVKTTATARAGGVSPEPLSSARLAPEPPARAQAAKPTPTISQLESNLLKAMASKRAGLPLLPDAAAQALRLARDPQSDMPRIARLVDRDPTLAARFLSLANSPLYSAGSRVVSTHGALVRLGLATARDLLLQVVYERSHGGGGRFQDRVSAVFSRSVMAAIATSEIARTLSIPFEDTYLCGLLHDIGEARIWRVLGDMDVDDPSIVEPIVARHHARAGAEVARAWGLPAAVIEACEEHHENPKGKPARVKLIMMGDVIADLACQPRKPGEAPRLTFNEGDVARLDELGLDHRVATITLQGVFIAGRMVVT
jgi:diguanylate cyclase (GGDEF)-like protein/putative nucleotidyltransferase with HDIG domain